MYNTWEFDIVWVREMGLEVYVLVIFTSLEVVNAHNDFGEEGRTGGVSDTVHGRKKHEEPRALTTAPLGLLQDPHCHSNSGYLLFFDQIKCNRLLLPPVWHRGTRS